MTWTVTAAIGLVILVGLQSIVSSYFRLRHVPGPWITSFTDFWRTYRQTQTNFTETLLELHEKYGPIVRLGPNSCSVADPAMVPVIYNTKGDFHKADSYLTSKAVAHGEVVGSVIDQQDEQHNAMLRRAVGNAVSNKSVSDYEENSEEAMHLLFKRLEARGTVDVFDSLKRFQADFLMRTVFSEKSDFLSHDEDITRFTAEVRVRHWVRWQSWPKLEHILFKSRFAGLFLKENPPVWNTLAEKMLQFRTEGNVPAEVTKGNDLLSKYLAAAKKNMENLENGNILRMISSTIGAAFDSSAFTLTTVIYFLLQHPNHLAKLMEEIDATFPDGPNSAHPSWSQVNTLPYLDAVLKESIRLYPFLNFPIERVVPPQGAMICGKKIPGGSIVAATTQIVGRDQGVFGKDSDEFRPDRWIVDDHSKRVTMERAFLGFGAGKRSCMGRHLAEMEMKKAIPFLLLNFKLSLVDPSVRLESKDGITSPPKPIIVKFDRITAPIAA